MNLFKDITELDKLLHEPARLAIMTALAKCESADFTFLQNLTGLSKGNLSSHLAKLEEAEFLTMQKTFVGKMPKTLISLTAAGTGAIDDHWQKLDDLRRNTKKWKPKLVIAR